MTESAVGTSKRNKRAALPSPDFASLFYLKIARGHGREGLPALQQNVCSGGKVSHSRTGPENPCRRVGKGPLEKENISLKE